MRGLGAVLSGELLAGMANEGFQARAKEVEREQRGRARFQEGVARSGITARDIREAVVRVFGAMDLAPDLDEEGMLLGLRILGLDDDSVMRAAGFRAGDRITALDDSELHDPADLPELLARSAKELDVCAQRAGEAFCRTVSLE